MTNDLLLNDFKERYIFDLFEQNLSLMLVLNRSDSRNLFRGPRLGVVKMRFPVALRGLCQNYGFEIFPSSLVMVSGNKFRESAGLDMKSYHIFSMNGNFIFMKRSQGVQR